MEKITALIKHLMAAANIAPEKVEAYADKGELMPTGRHLGVDGNGREQVEIGVWKYDAVISVEDFVGSGAEFMAIVLGWLADTDPDREGLADPELDIEINDATTCDLQLACEFEERLTVVAEPCGRIAFEGKSWVLATPELVTATTLAGLGVGRGN